MTHKHVLTLHAVIFFSFVAAALCTPFLAIKFPGFFASYFYLPSVVLLAVLVMASWPIFGGCPFTVWENRLRKIHAPETAYAGSCLPHYTRKWFGIKLPGWLFTAILVCMLLVPVAVGVIKLAQKFYA